MRPGSRIILNHKMNPQPDHAGPCRPAPGGPLSLNPLVVDKATLLRRMGASASFAAFEAADLTEATSWHQACRVFADGFVDAS